eukprot:4193650-Pyramimonas_sp.AAC.1
MAVPLLAVLEQHRGLDRNVRELGAAVLARAAEAIEPHDHHVVRPVAHVAVPVCQVRTRHVHDVVVLIVDVHQSLSMRRRVWQ